MTPPRAAAGRARLFHHVGRSDVDRVRAAIDAGAAAYCLTADPRATAALDGQLTALGADALVEFDLADTRELSLVEFVERLYERLSTQTRVPAALERLMRSPDAHLFYRRALFLEVALLLALAVLVGEEPLETAAEVELDPRWPGVELLGPLLGAIEPELGELPAPLAAGLRRLRPPRSRTTREAAALWKQIARFWLVVFRRLGAGFGAQEPVPLVLRTYGTDLGIDIAGQPRLRNIDFVVGGDAGLGPELVGVWTERGTGAERAERSVARGYRLVGLGHTGISPAAFARSVVPAAAVFTVRALRSPFDERWWFRVGAGAAAAYLYTRCAAARFRPRVFLSVNELLPDSVARNVALRQAGCTSVQYHHTCHWRAGPDGWIRDYVFAFAVVDVVATWGQAHTAHILSHRGAVSRCWEVGCIWSEHARLVREVPELRQRYTALLEQAHGTPLDRYTAVVGVFDTSPNILTLADLDAFRLGVLELAEALPDVLFVLKPKNPVAEGPPAPPNVVTLPNVFETAAVVGLANLTISACFTSTLVETVGSRRAGIYFDPTDRIPDAFWRKIPGLVCTSPTELEGRVRELLAADQDDVDAWLHEHFGELEGHFDGLAITRLRQQLVDELRRAA